MRFRSTLLLALLALALGAYVVFVEFERAAIEDEKETLLTFLPGDVTTVKLTYPDGEISVERSGDGWQLTAPIDSRADNATVDGLIRAVADCEVKKTLEDASQDLSVYGLDQPSATVELTLADGALPAVRVGKTSPIGQSTYVQRGDRAEVFLTDSAFHTGMKKELTELREKKILTFGNDDVQEITIRNEETDVVLRQSDGTWQLQSPTVQAADAQVVRTFLSTLQNLRAVDFHDGKLDDLVGFGLDEPRLAVSFLDGDSRQQVRIGDNTDDNNVYLQVVGHPTIYEVGSWTLRDLSKDSGDFRDKTVLAFEPDDLKAIELTREDGETVQLQRGDDDLWTMPGESALPEASTIEDLVRGVAGLKGQDVAAEQPDDLGAYGLASPTLKVTLTGADDSPLGVILLGSYEGEDDTKHTAMRAGGSTVFHITEYDFDDVNKTKADLLPAPTPVPTAAQDAG